MNEENVIALVSDGFEKAKSGDAVKVYEEVAGIYESGRLPLKSHYPFGWIIYYSMHKSSGHDIASRKRMLGMYLRLGVAKPHKLHSMILTEAIRLYKDAREASYGKRPEECVRFSIVRFLSLWDPANLRPGDWRRKEYEGKMLSSTVEKLITAYVDELEESRTLPASEFVALIERALQEYPDTFTLLSQRASLHLLCGEKDEARGLLRKALVNSPGKFFLWSRLASLVDAKENPRLKAALLYKALKAPGQEQFKGKVRMSLAATWLAAGAYPQALWEMQCARRLYEQNGWHLSRAFQEMEKSVPEGTPAHDPAPAYASVEHLADEEVYSALPEIAAVKSYHKNPKPEDASKGYGRPAVAWRVTDADGRNYWIQPHRFNIPANLPMGTKLRIRVHNGKAVKAQLAETDEADIN